MAARDLPIEHPERILRFREAISAIEWKPGSYRGALDVIFAELGRLIQAEIDYYYYQRVTARRVSWWCRFLAWDFGAAGILVPLVHPILGERAPENFLSWGYLAFGAAGLMLLLNNLFGGSLAHQRYTKSQLELEHLLQAFAVRWQRGLIPLHQQPSAEAATELLDEARAFVESFHKVLASETAEWKMNLDASLAEAKSRLTASGQSNS